MASRRRTDFVPWIKEDWCLSLVQFCGSRAEVFGWVPLHCKICVFSVSLCPCNLSWACMSLPKNLVAHAHLANVPAHGSWMSLHRFHDETMVAAGGYTVMAMDARNDWWVQLNNKLMISTSVFHGFSHHQRHPMPIPQPGNISDRELQPERCLTM